ncbi:hypothetical protein I3760_15G100100 [Carya illinoinensis]|nr:hypothetical protein I3760_15G100100 [Carya illinoinensis]
MKMGISKNVCVDIEGMLALYEASFHLREGESILEEAKDFATKHLKEYVDQSKDQYLCMMVNHALELPLHWRVIRLEARWFIDAYRSREDMNPTLLELAKLDFNMVQAVHQEDIKEMSRWWRSTGLGDLSFSRDRVLENFIWATGALFHPQFGHERRMLAKLGALVTVIDDVYDVYGTLEELELFTDAIERWDVNEIEQLPYYMQICFLSVYNTVNEMAFDTLKEKGCNIIWYMRKAVRPKLSYSLLFTLELIIYYNSSNSLSHHKSFSGQIYVNLICWKQNGFATDIHQAFKNTLKMDG